MHISSNHLLKEVTQDLNSFKYLLNIFRKNLVKIWRNYIL
ncbi:hypothetical protein HMPREF3229_01845 [Peptoniphilus harei]|uniref:Uncharacterized protein n=1 Tax=Peptoniphilus harei TaxID=54005 RepID=A0A133PGU7_9FIRM|nr:hypothetical protein HMPREF3229_01845 [Peptoniphilus harei]